MNQLDIATVRLMGDEGWRELPYKDSVGVMTYGYGFNLQQPLPKPLGNVMLNWWVQDLDKKLAGYYWYPPLDDLRKSVMIDVAYNVGLQGLLHFPKMISALSRKDWVEAAKELLDSDAARLNVARYKRLAAVIEKGVPT